METHLYTYQSYSFTVANLIIGEYSKESHVDEEVHHHYHW